MKNNRHLIIESPANPKFRSLLSLLEAKGVKKEGQFLISGQKLVHEAITNKSLSISYCIISKNMAPPTGLSSNTSYIELSKSLFNELDEYNTQFPLLIAATPNLKTWSNNTEPSGAEVFLALQDPANLGAALRVCEAFEVKKVILLKECSHPFHAKAVRSASGSSWRVPLYWGPSIYDLKSPKLFSLDLSGEPLNKFKWPKDFQLLLGIEGPGIPEELKNSSHPISIPLKVGMDSLNAVSALSIALYTARF